MARAKNNRSSQIRRQREKEEHARRKIIETAYRLFRDDGYLAVSLDRIAAEAGLSLATVVSLFGSKFMLLDALAKFYTRGDDSPTLITSRTWWQEMLQEPDAAEQLRMYVKIIQVIHERTMGFVEIIRRAAAADPEIAAMRQVLNDDRLQDIRPIAVSLAAKDAFHPYLTIDKARDILWTLGSADIYRAMVLDLHWSGDEYQAWLSDTLIVTLLRKGLHK